ncbi:uncharacterized protein LOC120737671 [Simochromis diagramma]|uniref:uncharacterized protein LOC120737671 n=1 Tax=Simochromis diagramma TaxID=43689 RepID=UPI001A7ECC3A|nr:uncharacterized protein LOC120737671 [Simochromis diagramma]
MASEEDDVLLFLIYQHLKVNGYQKAAQVLEKHVTQVETPVESSSTLHDIYTGWMKLYSLAQHAKQETQESSYSKKSIKAEAADTRLSSVTGGDDVASNPPLEPGPDVVEPLKAESISESVCEQLLAADNKSQATNSDSESAGSSDSEVEEEKIKEEETKTEQESAPTKVCAEASNEAESLSSASSDAEEITAPSQGNNSLVLPDQAEDQSQAPDPAEASVSGGDLKVEHQEGQ